MSIWEKAVKGVGNAGAKSSLRSKVVTATGVAGVGASVSGTKDKIKDEEEKLMERYTGKYAHLLALNEFRLMAKEAAHRPTDSNPQMGLGQAAGRGMLMGLTGGFAGAVGAELTNAGIGGMVAAHNNIKDMTVHRKARVAILQRLLETEPSLKRYETEHPGDLEKLYATMSRFAPTLSTDPHAVLSFLRNAIMMGGAIDYRTIEGLATAETAIKKALAHGGGSWR
jgi:hypothetical protein